MEYEEGQLLRPTIMIEDEMLNWNQTSNIESLLKALEYQFHNPSFQYVLSPSFSLSFSFPCRFCSSLLGCHQKTNKKNWGKRTFYR